MLVLIQQQTSHERQRKVRFKMSKNYCVVYLSCGGIHYRFRCTARNKREAKKFCIDCLAVKSKDIVEIYEEN